MKFFLALAASALACLNTHAQADPSAAGTALKDSAVPGALQNWMENQPVSSTFKSTRLINGHTVESTGHGTLDFRIGHRFGAVNQGIQDLFGLDVAITRFGFDYGATDWLSVGVGRSSYQKEYDGWVKAAILRQTVSGTVPVSVSYLGAVGVRADAVDMGEGREWFFSNRVAYTNSLLITRRFSRRLSLQLSPTHVHYNLVRYRDEPNDILAIGFGGRLGLSRRVSLTGEWFPQLPSMRLRDVRNSLSLGIDIETGGHVFQLHFTNSTGMTERTFIGQTTGNPWDGDVRFGFNVSRVFTVVRPKEVEGLRNRIE